MSNYVDLVSVQFTPDGKQYVFRAPRWSGLTPGKKVVCETSLGNNEGEVIACTTVTPGDSEYEFICKLAGVTELKRVLSVVKYSEFTYDDESDAD